MRISRPSANNLAMLAAILTCTAALAQDSSKISKSKDSAKAIEAQGSPAMDRMKRAIGAAKHPDMERTPTLPTRASPSERRRAFEALSRLSPSPLMDARARAALKANEAAMAVAREEQGRRLRQALGLEPGATEAQAKAALPSAPKGWVPVLFVSSSIPIPVLRAYAAQLERAHGVLAFRGIPGGLRKVAPMARLSAQILRRDPGCEGPECAMRDVQLIVDPIAFRQHGVVRVPALAMIPGDPARAYCEREDESLRSSTIVYGDSALSGLLEETARLGGNREVRDVQAALHAR